MYTCLYFIDNQFPIDSDPIMHYYFLIRQARAEGNAITWL